MKRSLILIAFALTALGCRSRVKTPQPPPPVEEKKEETPKEAETTKPPHKCDSLGDNCHAESNEQQRIANTDRMIAIPQGWTYYRTDHGLFAQQSAEGPAFAASTYEVNPSKKDDYAPRQATFEALLKELGATSKKKVTWKKPDKTKGIGGAIVGMWQLENAKRGNNTGPILIFAFDANYNTSVLGVGFVPNDDASGADGAILRSVESLTQQAPQGGSQP